jgi:MFS family permease
MSFAFAYIGVLGALVQGGLLRRLLKRDIEKQLVIAGSLILAASLWLLPRVEGTAQFLGVSALLALGNGFVVPTLSGMASRHVHGRAQGRVLGLSSAAGSLGRFLGPMLAALPLPLAFSEWERPLTGEHLAAANHGYLVAFSWAAGFLVVTAIVAILMRVPKDPPVE